VSFYQKEGALCQDIFYNSFRFFWESEPADPPTHKATAGQVTRMTRLRARLRRAGADGKWTAVPRAPLEVAQRAAKTDDENDEDESPANDPPTREATARRARMDAKI
jgi:hypothetical protein